MLDHLHGVTMYAVIQAGGAGTRLKTITGDLPKVMVEICGKPILEWQLESLKKSGIHDFLVIISKNGKAISDYFGDGKKFGVSISYIKEESPLGTAGGLYFARSIIKDDFILCFGDLMLDVDWMRFHRFHKEKGSVLTAFAHPNSHPFDSDLLVPNEDEKIIKIDSKNKVRDYYYENLTNAGLYVCSKKVLDYVAEPTKIDFEKVVLKHFVEEGKAYAYRSSEYVKDCGTPDRFYSVENDLKNGIIHGKSLANPQKCIFLDRDGTINEYRGLVTKTDELELEEDAASAIQKSTLPNTLRSVSPTSPLSLAATRRLKSSKTFTTRWKPSLEKAEPILMPSTSALITQTKVSKVRFLNSKSTAIVENQKLAFLRKLKQGSTSTSKRVGLSEIRIETSKPESTAVAERSSWIRLQILQYASKMQSLILCAIL